MCLHRPQTRMDTAFSWKITCSLVPPIFCEHPPKPYMLRWDTCTMTRMSSLNHQIACLYWSHFRHHRKLMIRLLSRVTKPRSRSHNHAFTMRHSGMLRVVLLACCADCKSHRVVCLLLHNNSGTLSLPGSNRSAICI